MSAGGTRSSANEHTAEELFVTQRCAPREGTPDCPPRSGLTCLHSIRRPVCTNTREPSATNAESGGRRRISPKPAPYRASPSPSNRAFVLTHTRHGSCGTRYSIVSFALFAVHHPRQPGDCDAWHKFAHKHHAPSDFAALATPHIKTQIYFVEIAVEGNCQESVKLGVQKLKTHEAYKSPPLKLIQLNSARNVLPQNSRLDFVVQHH